ncbi:MAG: hypothetical protein KBT48_10475 [Firmicutes bacterium]|nr:hypothetical protein [Bacillota bacterium]
MKCGFLSEKGTFPILHQVYASLQIEEFSSFISSQYEVKSFLNQRDFDGVEVARQFQKYAYIACDEVDENAHKAKLVNCIRNQDGRLIGTNTDYEGIKYTFISKHVDLQNKVVLIVGNAQNAKVVKTVCEDMGAKSVKNIFYKPSYGYITYKEAYSKYKDADILINTISVGRNLQEDNLPIDLSKFSNVSFVFDLIYTPLLTRLLLEAKKRNIPYSNGLSAFVYSHICNLEFFENKKLEADPEAIKLQLIKNQCNIVFIGMPSAGKSTTGRRVRGHIHKRWIDLDNQIVHEEEKPIAHLFEELGENGYREIESRIVKKFAGKSGLIISTGGGVISRDINMILLSQNGILIHLNRPLEFLKRKDSRRPILKNNKIEDLFEARFPIYQKYADFTIDTENSIEDAIQKVLKLVDDEQTYNKFK